MITRDQQWQRSQPRDLDRPLLFILLRELRLADRCFAISTSFLDSRTASASFALARRLISRSSPLSAISRKGSFRLALHSHAPRLDMGSRELSHPLRTPSVTLVGCIVGSCHQAEKALSAANPRGLSSLNRQFAVLTHYRSFGGHNESYSHPPVR